MLTPVSFAAQSVKLTRLANGLTVFVIPDNRFPLASLRLYVHAGSTYEDPRVAGISHVLEHMVFKGTKNRPKGAIAQQIESAGGYLNAATSFDYTVYLTDMPAQEWKLGLNVLKDMAFHPTLDAAELEAEKDVIIAELERGEDTPQSRIFHALQASAFKNTPYARPIIGYRDTIKNMTADDIRNYIDTYYQPQSMLLVVVGDVNPEEVIAQAEQEFGSITNNRAITPPTEIDASSLSDSASVTIQHGPWKKVYFGMALPVPGMKDATSPQLDILAYLLGGDATSRLYKKFKYDTQLVDDISVGNYSFERTGLLYFTAVLDADKLEDFWKAFTKELAQLQGSSFSHEELSRAKLNLEDALYRSKETVAGIASKEGYFQFFNGGRQGEANYLKALQDVSTAQLDALVDTWLTPNRVNVALLLPEGVTAPAIEPILHEAWHIESTLTKPTASASHAGELENIDLGDGRRVILIPDATLPYTAVDVVFTGGDSLLAETQQGLAALTASVLTTGTEQLDSPAMETFQAERAATLSASAGRQSFSISMRQPARFDADMFALLHDVITKPAFEADEVQREKQNQIASIKSREDQPLGLAFRHLMPFLFSGHHYGYFHLGKIDEVNNFSVQNVRHFWKEQVEQPWVMAVAGQFDRKAVLAFARSLPKPSAASKQLPPPSWNNKKTLDLTLADRNQAHVLLLFPTAGLPSADTPALELLQAILAGQSGLLFRDLRDEQSLGYTVTAMNWQSNHAGFIAFYIGTEPGKIEQAIEGFRKVISSLQEKQLPEAELIRGKNQLKGDYYREHQKLGSRSSEAATLASQGYPLELNKHILEEAEKLTGKDLQNIAKRYLSPDGGYIIRVTP